MQKRPAFLALARIRAHLSKGGVIAYPTESCYGLGCDQRSAKATRLILKLKHRPQQKGLILVGGSIDQIERYISRSEKNRAFEKYWPGPYTLLLRASNSTPRWLRGKHEKIALRITAHPETSGLCMALGMPLVSTSANVSGTKPARTYRECIGRFGKNVLVIPGKIGKRKSPSTIMDMETGRILRP